MARWILDPKSVRPAAHMPKLLHGVKAKEDAEAIAVYLASLKHEPAVKFAAPLVTRQNTPAEGEGAAPSGESKPIYERLHCAGCHNPPDATEIDPAKLSQKSVGAKFPRGKLAAYLRAPDAHYAWTRMPDFRLSEAEAKELEDYLLTASDKPKDVPAPADAAILERGRKLVQTTGCLNCHGGLKLENQFKAPPLDALSSRHLKDRSKLPPGNCLGATPLADYGFSAAQRTALDAFTLDGLPSLGRYATAEFAQRQTRLLNCNACHGQIDLVPALEILGGKL
jgi:mono/diheme cytochrome c family protein